MYADTALAAYLACRNTVASNMKKCRVRHSFFGFVPLSFLCHILDFFTETFLRQGMRRCQKSFLGYFTGTFPNAETTRYIFTLAYTQQTIILCVQLTINRQCYYAILHDSKLSTMIWILNSHMTAVFFQSLFFYEHNCDRIPFSSFVRSKCRLLQSIHWM